MKKNVSIGNMNTIVNDGKKNKENRILMDDDEIGGYKVKSQLGSGGMGEVYLVENIQMHKKYALKVLPPGLSKNKKFIDRFRVEARVMADLSHPNIVKVHNIGHDKKRDLYYLVMEFILGVDSCQLSVDGEKKSLSTNNEQPTTIYSDLEQLLKEKKKLSEDYVFKITKQLCSALDYAHEFRGKGIVHRDLKPSNILIGTEGNAHIADFGLAKVVGQDYLKSMMIHPKLPAASLGDMNTMVEDRPETIDLSAEARRAKEGYRLKTEDCSSLTSDLGSRITASKGITTSLIGTYEYMAPEQQEGGEGTFKSDIYSLGLIIYRMLTGRKAKGRFKLPSQRGCTDYWDEVIDKCLQAEPEERFSTVYEIECVLPEDSESQYLTQPLDKEFQKEQTFTKLSTDGKKIVHKLKYSNNTSTEKEITATELEETIEPEIVTPDTELWQNRHDDWMSAEKYPKPITVKTVQSSVNNEEDYTEPITTEPIQGIVEQKQVDEEKVCPESDTSKSEQGTIVQNQHNDAENSSEPATDQSPPQIILSEQINKEIENPEPYTAKPAPQIIVPKQLNDEELKQEIKHDIKQIDHTIKKIAAEVSSLAVGNVIKEKSEKQIDLWKKAADMGLPEGQFFIGACKEYGYGCDKDEDKSLNLYILSSIQGNAHAQFMLGEKYRYNNRRKAEQLYRKAAEKNSAYAEKLALDYELGKNCVYKNINKAKAYYKIAADLYKKDVVLGETWALMRTAFCCRGAGDHKEAVKWYRKAADKGDVFAQLKLGQCHEEGRGIEENPKESAKWYRKAAEQGDKTAQACLGTCYCDGYGVTKNDKEAQKWLKKAAEQGDKTALELLEKLKHKAYR